MVVAEDLFNYEPLSLIYLSPQLLLRLHDYAKQPRLAPSRLPNAFSSPAAIPRRGLIPPPLLSAKVSIL